MHICNYIAMLSFFMFCEPIANSRGQGVCDERSRRLARAHALKATPVADDAASAVIGDRHICRLARHASAPQRTPELHRGWQAWL